MFILKFWRELIILTLVGVAAFLYMSPAPEAVTKVEVKTVERVVTKVVEKVKEIRPDGTVIEKEVVTDKKEDTKLTDKNTAKVIPQRADKYSVGVAVRNLDYKDLLIDVGARLGDTPFEAVVGFEPLPKTVTLGVRVRF